MGRGFTLIELSLVLILVGIASVVGIEELSQHLNAERYESTRAQIEAYGIAILGNPNSTRNGDRVSFGYVGDWGSLPATLSNLITAQAPAWSYDATHGVGAGWHGPYLQGSIGGVNPTLDGWGNAYIYSPAASPPSLTSYASDASVGGTSFNEDIQLTFPTSLWQGNVSGTVRVGDTVKSGETVEIRYPVAGVLTAFTTVTAADGSFNFANVPYGVRSLAVTAPAPLIGPKQVVVQRPQNQFSLVFYE